jgi:hypothetical protein
MTRRTNARVAGVTFLVYIAVAMTAMILESRAASGEGTAATLASIAGHASQMRLAFLLELTGCFCALVLAVTLWAITRDEDPDLAMLALTCRVAEGVIGGVSLLAILGQLWLATGAGADAPDPTSAAALGAYLLKLPSWSSNMTATFFAVGSTIFAYLLLRGRIVPVGLAWLGVLASILVVVCLPLELVGILGGPIREAMWFPMLAFEVLLALWLIIKGAAMPPRCAALSEA